MVHGASGADQQQEGECILALHGGATTVLVTSEHSRRGLGGGSYVISHNIGGNFVVITAMATNWDVKYSIKIRSDWPQMVDLSSRNVLKLILRSPRFVAFGSNLTQFGTKPDIPAVKRHGYLQKGCQIKTTIWQDLH